MSRFPFFRSFLQEFDSKKYPKVKTVHLHTNGNLWTPSMWNSMKNVHPYVGSVEISIDASNKETYDIVRRNGDWDMLMENLDYINTLDTIDVITLSFVVQNINYKEIFEFEKLKDRLNNIPQVRTHYHKILDWGHMSDFDERAVWKPEHRNYNDFRKLWDEFIKKTDKEQPLLVYCYHGNSSQVVAEYFSENGCNQVYTIDGGFDICRAKK